MHRVARRVVVAVLAPLAGVTLPPSLSAQLVQGPTYSTGPFGAWAPMTLTAWTELAGINGDGFALYRHWFTGTMTLGPFHPGPGATMSTGATERFYLAPWDGLGPIPPGTPPNPYTACGCFTYSLNGSFTDGSPGLAVAINTAATMGAILTTIPGFIAPSVEQGSWGYTTIYPGGSVDRDNGGDLAFFRVTAAAPGVTVTPEPATVALLAGGLLALAPLARRKRRAV